NTVSYMIWHLEFYRELSELEKSKILELVSAEADIDGLVTYYTRVRKGAIFLDKKAGFLEDDSSFVG
ncbi:hypothetical protein KAI46_06255, partial [bacterium]|nr:hypothetical protein [bacterium]